MEKNLLFENNVDNNIKYNTNIFYFLKNSFVLSYYNMNWSLNFLFAFTFINLYNDTDLTSYFSFGLTLFSILTLQISLGFPEIIGIEISKLRGMGKIIECYKVMIKYFFIMLIFIFISLIFIFFLKDILKILQIEKKLIENSMRIIYYSIPYFIIMPINKTIESLFITFNKKFFLLYSYTGSYLILIIFLYIGYLLRFTYFLFPFAKLIQEIYLLMINLYYMNKEFINLKEFIKLYNFNEVKHNFLNNAYYAFKIVIGVNCEVISFEINTLYLGRKNNKYDISVWVAFVNFAALVYCFSFGLANSIRTEIGYLLGANKPQMAKSFFKKILKNLMIIFFIYAIIQAMLSYYIGLIYFREQIMLQNFSKILKMYIIISVFDLTVPLLATICRIIGRVNFYVISHLYINPLLMIIFGNLFIIILDLGSLGCIYNFIIAQSVVFSILFYGYYYGDFSKGTILNN